MIVQISNPVLSVETFAKAIGLEVSAVNRLIILKKIPVIKVSERKTLINVALLTRECLSEESSLIKSSIELIGSRFSNEKMMVV